MYGSSRDVDSSGRKLSKIRSGLAQCKDCSEAAELHSRHKDIKRCPEQDVRTGLNDMALTWPREDCVSAALPITTFDQKRALRGLSGVPPPRVEDCDVSTIADQTTLRLKMLR